MAGGVALAVPGPVQTDPDKLRWGIVSTVKAPLEQVARFAAFYLDMGAHRVHLHLDLPDPALAEQLSHPRVRVHQCDDAYWAGKPEKLRESHQLRQAFNATRIYRISTLDWLAHIDVDEFVLAPGPIKPLLAAADPSATHIAMAPVEMLDTAGDPHHFKRTGPKAALRQIYPTYGEHVAGGFISTQSPKNIARTGLDGVRLGIHALRHHGKVVNTGTHVPGLEIGHAHAPDWETFHRHVMYRLDKGSYRNRKGRFNPLGGLIKCSGSDVI
ncbi:glycosyltransferase family 2 protein [Tateyamaria sp.]|uniref:glycosyltransferase family 2 protein n=1 Tax=Tateyamaria sp. TaxID=1929288 RepID=UPI003B22081D